MEVENKNIEFNNEKTEYKFSIEENEEIDNDLKNLTADQITKMVVEQNATLQDNEVDKPLEIDIPVNDTPKEEENQNEASGYVYVLEPDHFKRENVDLEDKKVKESDNSGELDAEDSEPKLIIDLSKGSSMGDTSIDLSKNKQNPVANKQNSEISEVSSMAPTGANKRKRNMHNVLSSILRQKINPETSEDNDKDNAQPNKMHITEDYVLNTSKDQQSPSTGGQWKEQDGLDLRKPLANDSGLDLTKGTAAIVKHEETLPKPLNLATPIPSSGGRKNRRKTYVPIKCEKIEATDVNEYVEVYGKTELNGHTKVKEESTPMDLTPMSKVVNARDGVEKTHTTFNNGPMDLSARSSPVNLAMKKERVSPVDNTWRKHRVTDSPVDLSARNSPILCSTPKNSVQHSSSNSPTMNAAPKNNALQNILNGYSKRKGRKSFLGQPGLPPFMPSPINHQTQMKDFMEIMSKVQANAPNPNMLQANAQMMQFQALMHSAMLNNQMMSLNQNLFQNEKNTTSDKNDNIVKTEPKTEAPKEVKSRTKIQEFNMELLQKNGLMQNSYMPGMNGFGSQMMPYLSNQAVLPLKGTPGRRRRSKESPATSFSGSFLERTTIPKLEDVPALRTHIDEANPENIVDTLKLLFPQQPLIEQHQPFIEGQLEPEAFTGVRFFVKDNEQIQIIVDSLLIVCEIRENELVLQGDQGFKNVCRLCDATFFHMEHLTKHIKKIHVVKRYQCTQCER